MPLCCRRMFCSLLFITVLVVLPFAASVSAVDGGPGDDMASQEQVVPEMQTAPEADATVTQISVDSDGTAVWQITIRMQLSSEEDREEFAAFEQEFEQNRSSYLDQFRERMSGVVENAAMATNREMNASAFETEIGIQEVPRRWGYVTYRFEWTGFAQRSDGTITVGDVFRGGLFLEAEDILIIDTPAEYEVTSVDPAPGTRSDGELQWNGPDSFNNERPQVQLAGPDSEAQAETDDDQTTPGGSSFPLLYVLTGAALIALVAGFVYMQVSDRDTDTENATGPVNSGTEPPEQADSEPETAVGTGTDLNLDELATEEDRVKALLRSEDGRMRQADIAERLDWSASKTSRVLSDMTDNEEIEKLRIGRENVIDLSDGEDDS